MPDDALLQRLRQRLPDKFSRDMLDGALQVLGQPGNKMRAHQFATTLREMFSHVLELLSPDADVMRCPWFKQDKDLPGPTRRQRAIYSCRGGLTDDFLKKSLKLNPKDLHSEFSASFQELNNRTHVRPDTVLSDQDEIDKFADAALASLEEVFVTIDHVRMTIAEALEKELHGQAMSVFINETIQELDEISGRYETGAVWIEEAVVISLDANEIQYCIKGHVDVSLIGGSKSDQVEFKESFPFECTTVAPAFDPTEFDSLRTEMKVDTSSWHGDGE